jgi:hypothetical protein
MFQDSELHLRQNPLESTGFKKLKHALYWISWSTCMHYELKLNTVILLKKLVLQNYIHVLHGLKELW